MERKSRAWQNRRTEPLTPEEEAASAAGVAEYLEEEMREFENGELLPSCKWCWLRTMDDEPGEATVCHRLFPTMHPGLCVDCFDAFDRQRREMDRVC